MTELDRLCSLLFENEKREVLNIKILRGKSENLTIEELCQTVREVIEDTWENEAFLVDEPPYVSERA